MEMNDQHDVNDKVIAGIDIGSVAIKIAIINGTKILNSVIVSSGGNFELNATNAFERCMKEIGLSRDDIDLIVSTGYGRRTVDFSNKDVTEIKAHAKGAKFLFPTVKTIIDIGGQDCKIIVVDDEGEVKDFRMNDRCAAGTGRFLQMIAQVLETDLQDLGELSLASQEPVKVNSTCIVFAESETISLLARGRKRDDIIAGIHDSIADRIEKMASQAGYEPDIFFDGGCSRNLGLKKALEVKFGLTIHTHTNGQIAGALGAALIGKKELERKNNLKAKKIL